MPRTAAPLSNADIDAFSRKLKATLNLAQQALALKATIAKLGSFGAPPAKAAKAAKAPAAPKKKAAAKAAPKKKAAGKRRRLPGIAPEKIAGLLKGAKDGLSLGEVAKKAGESNKDRVASALRKLRDSKQAKVVGDRQFARWFPA